MDPILRLAPDPNDIGTIRCVKGKFRDRKYRGDFAEVAAPELRDALVDGCLPRRVRLGRKG